MSAADLTTKTREDRTMTVTEASPEVPVPAAPVAICVAAPKLRDMLIAVRDYAHEENDTLPQLAAIRFEVRAGVLFMVATDRYTLGVARHALPGASAGVVPDIDAILPATAADSLIARLRDRCGVVALLVGGGQMKAECDGDELGAWHLLTETYPEWRAILAQALASEPGDISELDGKYGINPKFLVRLGQAHAGGTSAGDPEPNTVLLRTGCLPEGQPVALAICRGWFLAGVVPVRCTDELAAERAGSWQSWKDAFPSGAPA